MALGKPPVPLPPNISRYDQQGRPTRVQVEYERRVLEWITQLSQSFLPLEGSTLPTTNPHVVGQLWNNAGVVSVSAG